MTRQHRLSPLVRLVPLLALAAALQGCASVLPGAFGGEAPASLMHRAPSAEYPNINIIPPPPRGTLMTYDEERRTAGWLRQIGARQRAAAPRISAAESAAQAAEMLRLARTHGADALAEIEAMCRSSTGRPEDTVNCPR